MSSANETNKSKKPRSLSRAGKRALEWQVQPGQDTHSLVAAVVTGLKRLLHATLPDVDPESAERSLANCMFEVNDPMRNMAGVKVLALAGGTSQHRHRAFNRTPSCRSVGHQSSDFKVVGIKMPTTQCGLEVVLLTSGEVNQFLLPRHQVPLRKNAQSSSLGAMVRVIREGRKTQTWRQLDGVEHDGFREVGR